MIITDGYFAQKYGFVHEAENYKSNVCFILNKESITTGNKAHLIIRMAPKLFDEIPIPCELIENPEVTLTFESIDNIKIVRNFKNLSFTNNRDTIVEFTVPENGII